MEKIKLSLTLLIVIFLSSQLVLGHGLEEKEQETVSGEYAIAFATEPLYPVTFKETHLDFIVSDVDGKPSVGLNIVGELHKHDSDYEAALQAVEEESGHYSIKHVFTQSGNYEVHIGINGQETGKFELDVDSFGKSGWMRTFVIIGTLSLLVWLAQKDCKKNKR